MAFPFLSPLATVFAKACVENGTERGKKSVIY